MSAHVVTKEQIKHSLDAWYQAMLKQQVEKATRLKEEIESKISHMEEDQNISFYYSLLDFRYKVLKNGIIIEKNSFERIDSYNMPSDNFLSYYYHFFKAIHATLTTSYNEAMEHYEKAEKLLNTMPDKIEKAEFDYRFAIFNQHFYKPVEAIQYATKAKEIFAIEKGYEVKLALCDNIIGAACVFLKQYEQAEEKYNAAIATFQKFEEEDLVLSVRNNLGWLYASQNLSASAIRHLSEVTGKRPTHFKAVFLQAREYYKLGETNIAKDMIEQGYKLCVKLENEEYQHHYKILRALNGNFSTEDLENIILEGITFFDKELLYNYIQEYVEKLAVKFYQEDNHVKASKYFHIGLQAKEKTFEKGALK
ncbi:Rap family tetratricopeptide repeat protein [Bacillus pseudomycoides]|uniref:Rap family tetratricopeptide repeat protein n=1 Tax=Bacillus pseudomycoides TaxID=64104 RepID=UPI000BF0996F|nr:Rap family tetratricopeptide repeat protein [Bacillus pseudomycoides]PEI90953.1 hypothetical protein CN686_23210 [Bacillus pseudomycoides]PEM74385.1 hypothetical protein CN619_13200 [Bacillus pseudomycoides]PGA60500.1 hypothetical protein COL84_21635 [Bacillus pseudomycoides]PHA47907.1 hypothetical protein COE73_18080 [Bacillus pseudomycoides]PHA52256.1 hypothetical protein COE76_24095 [Bacillus pseudomycoides]